MTKQTPEMTTGYQSPAKMFPVQATIVKAVAGRSPPNQPVAEVVGQ